MEVEVKLRLPDAASHQLLSDVLSGCHVRTHLQENLFFDTHSGALSSRLSALRLRFYDDSSRCVLSLKSRPALSSGVSRVEEDEEDLDPSLARSCLPRDLSALLEGGGSSRILKRVREEYGVVDLEDLVCLGGFRNVRGVYSWREGLTLELDETRYDFGTSYEVECESYDPERAKELLEGFLKENGVPYSYSESSKFAVFRAGKLLP